MTQGATGNVPRLIPSTRFTLAILVSFALFVQYAQRVGLSMAIVCMVDRNQPRKTSNLTTNIMETSKSTTSLLHTRSNQWLEDRRFPWTEFQQQILLGAYWFGYIFTLVPGGPLSIALGPKRTFAGSILLSSIATTTIVIIYWVRNFNFYIALFFRVIIGFTHGPLFPATYTFWSMWAAPMERSTLTAIGFCSTNIGTSLTMLVGGVLCRYFNSGWVYIFIMTALFGFIWGPLWLIFVEDSPLTHRRISEKERQYICESLGIDKNTKKRSASLISLPWKDIIQSKAVIAVFITECCNLFGLFFFYTNVGKILTEIHGVPPQHAGYVLAIGFILMPICSLSSGIVADRLVKAKKVSLVAIRKVFNSIASFVPAICVIVLCFCDESRQIFGIITILILLASSATAYGSGYIVNFVDIMPACSSIVFGIVTAIATAGALGGNVIAGLIIKKPELEDWRRLFILFSIIYTIGGLSFLLLGSAEPCEWAELNIKKPTNNVETTNEEETTLMQTRT